MNLEFIEAKTSFSVFVPGIPAPGGSKKFVGHAKRTGRAILVDAGGARNKNWRAAVAAFAHELAPAELFNGALMACFEFTMPRPKYHFRTTKKEGTRLREDAPKYHISTPDTTKLVRSTEDALKGILWTDDSIIAIQTASKTYGEKPGCRITITAL